MYISYVGKIKIPNNYLNLIKFKSVRYLPTESNSAIGHNSGTYYDLFADGIEVEELNKVVVIII